MLTFSACSENPKTSVLKSAQGNDVPIFQADSAYYFIKKQLEFGPRNPNSEGHRAALQWKLNQFRSYAGTNGVYAQQFRILGYDDDTLSLTNIIASFNPSATDRILLCAHWDTRPRSEADPDSIKSKLPLLGADDGGSGVAVLLELARLFSKNPPPIGVDIVLFDGEDYGREGDLSMYFLGSRYWAQNPPVPGYKPRFGILLDMVGGKGASFPKEVNSASVAPILVDELWMLASELGYETLFKNELGLPIQDDHVILNQYTSFKTINIIHHQRPFGNQTGFPVYWHTTNDNLDIIDTKVLDAVGKTLTELIYNRL
jgi:glutaminyl-peptide cyclotransferase